MTRAIEFIRSMWRGQSQSVMTALVMAAALLVIHRVIFAAFLETTDNSATLIRLDLLQAVAFLVALSALLITITRLVVNKARDNELLTHQASWKADTIEELLKLHAQNHPNYTQDVQRLQTQFEELEGRLNESSTSFDGVIGQNELLVSENERLRKQLDELTKI